MEIKDFLSTPIWRMSTLKMLKFNLNSRFGTYFGCTFCMNRRLLVRLGFIPEQGFFMPAIHNFRSSTNFLASFPILIMLPLYMDIHSPRLEAINSASQIAAAACLGLIFPLACLPMEDSYFKFRSTNLPDS